MKDNANEYILHISFRAYGNRTSLVLYVLVRFSNENFILLFFPCFPQEVTENNNYYYYYFIHSSFILTQAIDRGFCFGNFIQKVLIYC